MFLFDEVDFAQTQNLPLTELWRFLPFGYALTVLIETPILVAGLPAAISLRRKLFCGIWLTACSYPVVVLVLPALFFGASRWQYLAVAETFAPAAECLLFWLAFRKTAVFTTRDWAGGFATIIIANLTSFGVGEIMNHCGWFGLF
jgi:hypothetical protein